MKVLEKGLEQHTKTKSEGLPVGFCKPGNYPETGTTKNLWFGVVFLLEHVSSMYVMYDLTSMSHAFTDILSYVFTFSGIRIYIACICFEAY